MCHFACAQGESILNPVIREAVHVHYRILENTISESKIKNIRIWRSCRGSAERNLTIIYKDAGSIPGHAQGVKDLVLL